MELTVYILRTPLDGKMSAIVIKHVPCASVHEYKKPLMAAAESHAACACCGDRLSALDYYNIAYPIDGSKRLEAYIVYFCHSGATCRAAALNGLQQIHVALFGDDGTRRVHQNCQTCKTLFHPRSGDYCSRCHFAAWCSPECAGKGRDEHAPYCFEGLVSNPSVKRCAECTKILEKHQFCSRCRGVYYCSTECQRTHWPKHKVKCVLWSAQIESAEKS